MSPVVQTDPPVPRQRFFTHIRELDALFGGAGVPAGSVILVSGDPGTGKTTLAWEMVRRCAPAADVAFLSCDELADMAFLNYRESYAPDEITDKYNGDALHLFDIVEDSEAAGLTGGPAGACMIYFRTVRRARAAEAGRSGVAQTLVKCIESSGAGVVIIDGLNSLIDVASEAGHRPPGDGEAEVRAVLRAVKADLRKLAPPKITIITCERRDDRSDRLYESYLADVTIELRREQIVPDPRRPTFVESILSCCVPKGRGMRVQRRRVCYDFAEAGPGRALNFFETYPADGLLSLFHENAPQRAFIEDFKAIDIPTLYPKLSVREFDLSNMYHEYAIRRRGRDIPSRRPLMVMNIDEYWVGVLASHGILQELDRAALRVYGSPRADGSDAGEFIDEIPPRHFDPARPTRPVRSIAAVPHFANVSMLVYRRPLVEPYLGPGPYDDRTLDEVEAACVTIKRDGAVEFPLRIEMKHVDTFASTLCELITCHGGDPRVRRVPKGDGDGLEFEHPDGLDAAGVATFARLAAWVHRQKIVRPLGTIDPTHPTNASNGRPTWAVARHWYSSLINHLFGGPGGPGPAVDRPRVRDIAVTPLPAAAGGRACCMWGEWYLAVESGAENMALAYAIIDSLLAPSKMITHAVTGAGLPVCKDFFREYGHVRCTGTDLTYAAVREKFFSRGIRRSEIAEYRVVMQKLYAAGLRVVQDPGCPPAAAWADFRASVDEERLSL